MTIRNLPPSEISKTLTGTSLTPLPSEWLTEVDNQLARDETVLAWREIDLDCQLRFSPGLVILTDQRLLDSPTGEQGWETHAFGHGQTLIRHDHSGFGSLELFAANSRLAVWRYTLGRDIAAGRLIRNSENHLSGCSNEV